MNNLPKNIIQTVFYREDKKEGQYVLEDIEGNISHRFIYDFILKDVLSGGWNINTRECYFNNRRRHQRVADTPERVVINIDNSPFYIENYKNEWELRHLYKRSEIRKLEQKDISKILRVLSSAKYLLKELVQDYSYDFRSLNKAIMIDNQNNVYVELYNYPDHIKRSFKAEIIEDISVGGFYNPRYKVLWNITVGKNQFHKGSFTIERSLKELCKIIDFKRFLENKESKFTPIFENYMKELTRNILEKNAKQETYRVGDKVKITSESLNSFGRTSIVDNISGIYLTVWIDGNKITAPQFSFKKESK